MAWAERYAKGWRGRYEVTDPTTGKTRKITAGSASTKKAAEQLAQKEELKIAGGRWVDPEHGKMTFSEYFETIWFPNSMKELHTKVSYQSTYDAHLKDAFGHMELRRILSTHVQAWIKRLEDEGYQPSTIVKYFAHLQSILAGRKGSSAVRDGYLERNPCQGIDLPFVPRREVQIYEPVETDTLLEGMDPWWRPLLTFLVNTGLRWGEAMGLQVDDFALGMRSFEVRRTIVETSKKWTDNGTAFKQKDYPKTRKPRTIWLDHEDAQMIAVLIQQRGLGPGDRIFSAPAKKAKHVTGEILTSEPLRTAEWPQGMPVARGHFRKVVWAKAHQRTGIKKLRPYDLRATNISWLLDGDAPIPVVMELAGHVRMETTKKYTKARRVEEQGLAALAKVKAQSRGLQAHG